MMIVIAVATVSPGRAQQSAVTVNGELITELEIDQRIKFDQATRHQTPPREEVIDELRKEKLKVQEARKFGIEVLDSDVAKALAEMTRRMRMTSEQFTQGLARSDVDIATVKHRIRADIAWQRYKRGSGNPSP
jgi:peptidyl-prolyl cis-trans isomerase SurA